LKGVDCLPPGFVVPCADLEAAETRQGVRVERGDILLVRTGWRRKVSRPLSRRTAVAAESDPRRLVLLPEAGLSQDCAVWLYEREVAAVAADTYAVEVIPAEDPAATLPVHCLVIRDMGMMLGELFDLEALAADCASDGRWDFFFAAPPLKVPNGLGSPINPIAVK
jgi:kynurenine formamidase